MKSILIHVGPGIGDMMQGLPMARDIKKAYPDARIDFIMRGTPSFYKIDSEILECQNFVNHLYWYSFDKILHCCKLIFQLLCAGRYDYGIVRVGSVTGSKSLWIYRMMRLLRCKTIIGSGHDKVDILVDDTGLHYLELHSRFVRAMGIESHPTAVSLKVEDIHIDDSLKKITYPNSVTIGMSVGSNPMKWVENGITTMYDVKSWPYSKWTQLSLELSEMGYTIFLFGGPKEKKEMSAEGVEVPSRNNIFNYIGATSIKESLYLVNKCDLMIGAEGGMMHTASAFGIQTLTIFGGTSPQKWNPGGIDSPIVYLNCPCAPCYGTAKAAKCEEHKCIKGITVEMVKSKVESILRNRISK